MASLLRRGLLVCPRLHKTVKSANRPVLSLLAGHKLEHLNLTPMRKFCSTKPSLKRETVTIHFVKPGGDKQSVQAKVGDNLLDVIIDNEVDIDGFGACEGTLACSTCHLIFKPDHFEQIDEKPTDEELDMLDLAYGLTDYSRLGCQVYVTKDMENWEVSVPEGIADARDV